jgi:hypothetical protein
MVAWRRRYALGKCELKLAGFSGFHKLLFIPVLLAQFRHIGHGSWAVLGLLASSAILLIMSWALALLPDLTWRGKEAIGVPVKDYVFQSELFAICAFGLIGQAASLWRTHLIVALMLVLGAALSIANIVYVEAARTTLVVLVMLACLFGFWEFRWKGALGNCLILAAIASAAWITSPYLRERVLQIPQNFHPYEANVGTSEGQRLEYWRKSLSFLASAPVLGHGTGSIPDLFRRDATPESHRSIITDNPHNQFLVIALELGIVMALCVRGRDHWRNGAAPAGCRDSCTGGSNPLVRPFEIASGVARVLLMLPFARACGRAGGSPLFDTLVDRDGRTITLPTSRFIAGRVRPVLSPVNTEVNLRSQESSWYQTAVFVHSRIWMSVC